MFKIFRNITMHEGIKLSMHMLTYAYAKYTIILIL